MTDLNPPCSCGGRTVMYAHGKGKTFEFWRYRCQVCEARFSVGEEYPEATLARENEEEARV